jgi:hypothetical protein
MAVALPIPEVAPVTIVTFSNPSILQILSMPSTL